ncbi:MAG TPA: A/G-specific adenine glycosylase [Candidatus Acidoferrales bacterium]|nr:A/G-specific adenine glycosylase [Candidatus Acidoferrales bacterium]
MSSEAVRPQIARLRKAVLQWYDANRRDLPWRRTRDPYRIWVSEIMLQQTRVAAVLEHYRRWFELFPDVNSLASAELNDVLAAWSGLGYYRRARMLHEAAKVIASGMNGLMPRTSPELRKLPGVGRYTAAAIASIAFLEPVAVVDGNVERVFARFYARRLSQKKNWETAQEWLHVKRPGDWNQAMMELGATVCTPVSPQCRQCPLQIWCAGTEAAQDASKSPSSTSARKRKVVAFALVQRNGSVYLVQRPADAKKMAAMWELPEVALDATCESLMQVRHSITDTDYVVHVYARSAKGIRGGRWCSTAELERMALTGLTRKVLRKLSLIGQ